MYRKVGRLTLALVLIIVGVVLVIDNLQGTHMGGYLAALWPALLIFLGIEWIVASSRVPSDERVRVDGTAIALLLLIALVGSSVSIRPGPRGRQTGPLPIPAIPPGPSIPNPFANASAENVFHNDNAGPVTSLHIAVSSANVTVEPGDKFAADLHVRAWGRDPQEAERNVQNVALQVTNGPETQVRIDLPPGGGRYDLQLEVKVPAGAAVTVEASSGSIRVTKVDGPVDLRTSSGGITAVGIGGSATLTATSGNINAKQIKGNVKASATSGSITADGVGGTLSVQSSSGHIDIRPEQIGGNYDLTATSGDVQLRLPDAAPVTVSARATSGTVSGPSWLTIGEGRNSGQGKNGAGTYTVTIRTSSGSITLR